MHERRVSRDIYPLPPVVNSTPLQARLSRKCRQRMGRRRHFEEEVGRTIDALNTLYGKPGRGRREAEAERCGASL